MHTNLLCPSTYNLETFKGKNVLFKSLALLKKFLLLFITEKILVTQPDSPY